MHVARAQSVRRAAHRPWGWGGAGLTQGPEIAPGAVPQAGTDLGCHAVTRGACLARAPRAVPRLWLSERPGRARAASLLEGIGTCPMLRYGVRTLGPRPSPSRRAEGVTVGSHRGELGHLHARPSESGWARGGHAQLGPSPVILAVWGSALRGQSQDEQVPS